MEKKESGPDLDQFISSKLNISQESLKIAMEYPNNITLNHYLRFLAAPTCCYQLYYPSTSRISKSFVIKRLLEVILGITVQSYLVFQHCLPVCQSAVEPLRKH